MESHLRCASELYLFVCVCVCEGVKYVGCEEWTAANVGKRSVKGRGIKVIEIHVFNVLFLLSRLTR